VDTATFNSFDKHFFIYFKLQYLINLLLSIIKELV